LIVINNDAKITCMFISIPPVDNAFACAVTERREKK
jgi:hypothetical protein